jgi:hypothetical protein
MKKLRKRITRETNIYKFKVGDLVKGYLPDSTERKHICIILEKENEFGHIPCIPVCNFTSKKGKIETEFSIDISKYDLPTSWFENKKPESWLRCRDKDCLYNQKFTINDILGNILEDFPELWKSICLNVISCPNAEKFNRICECEYEKTNELIKLGEIKKPDCGCI